MKQKSLLVAISTISVAYGMDICADIDVIGLSSVGGADICQAGEENLVSVEGSPTGLSVLQTGNVSNRFVLQETAGTLNYVDLRQFGTGDNVVTVNGGHWQGGTIQQEGGVARVVMNAGELSGVVVTQAGHDANRFVLNGGALTGTSEVHQYGDTNRFVAGFGATINGQVQILQSGLNDLSTNVIKIDGADISDVSLTQKTGDNLLRLESGSLSGATLSQSNNAQGNNEVVVEQDASVNGSSTITMEASWGSNSFTNRGTLSTLRLNMESHNLSEDANERIWEGEQDESVIVNEGSGLK